MDKVIEDYFLDCNYNHSELGIFILHTGFQVCGPDHCYGYATRDHYLIHYITEGNGEYHVGKKTYHLKKGDGFLICPGVSTLYKATNKNPWSYQWVGFNGKAVKQIFKSICLDENKLIFHYDKDEFLKDCLTKLDNASHASLGDNILPIGYLLLFLGKLHEQLDFEMPKIVANNKSHFDEALKYIQINYLDNIKISDIANHIGIDRTQLFRIFIDNIHISPKQYLMNYRINHAGILIDSTDLSFKEISDSIGFEYCSHFYRLFKQHYGMTPSEYRQRK